MRHLHLNVVFDRRDLRIGVWWPEPQRNYRAKGCTVHLPCVVFYVTWESSLPSS